MSNSLISERYCMKPQLECNFFSILHKNLPDRSQHLQITLSSLKQLHCAVSKVRGENTNRDVEQQQMPSSKHQLPSPERRRRSSDFILFLLFLFPSPAVSLKPIKRNDQNVQGQTESLRFGVLIHETAQRTNDDGSSCSRLHHRQP